MLVIVNGRSVRSRRNRAQTAI